MSKNQATPYRQCAMTVMDTIADPRISFDTRGVCNYYYEFKTAEKERVFTGQEGERKLKELTERIKKDGNGKQYDSIMGLSGGVDSSYVAYQAKRLGLRPLAVHFDNGWNSELAVMNIENIVSKLDLDLYTLVVDWEEFKDLQLAYLRASVVDIEVVTDHAITATLFRLAKKYKIKYVLGGSNVATECIMPSDWVFNKNDHINLRAIHQAFGKVPLKTYPMFDTLLKKYSNSILKSGWVSFLNYMPYNKEEVKRTIGRELGWRDYGGKHYESSFTKFYQAYILPEKFGIDKRKPHLSNLICAGQMTREVALEELKKPLYSGEELKQDLVFVLKKFGLSREEFDEIMRLPIRKHSDFAVETSVYDRYWMLKLVKPIMKRARK
ncbi:MAG TPA: N-acetyl sugar amidotransferase [Puia sp.]|jgi:N-acetyl sugar amidotransferase|nr:N-acetyl sugar amidotransferase [Puia sp.]